MAVGVVFFPLCFFCVFVCFGQIVCHSVSTSLFDTPSLFLVYPGQTEREGVLNMSWTGDTQRGPPPRLNAKHTRPIRRMTRSITTNRNPRDRPNWRTRRRSDEEICARSVRGWGEMCVRFVQTPFVICVFPKRRCGPRPRYSSPEEWQLGCAPANPFPSTLSH